MIAEKFCDVCDMPFDWEGITDGDAVYCCQGCANGEACTCAGHDHSEVLETMDSEAV